MKLLATVNRRVALKTKSVSPYCHVSFFNADDRTEPTSQVFLENDETVPFEMPVLVFGVDLSGQAKRFLDPLSPYRQGKIEHPFLDTKGMNEEQKRRP